MNFQYSGNNSKIIQAVSIANQLVINPVFYDQIAAYTSFKYSNYSGRQVADEIKTPMSPSSSIPIGTP